MALNNNQRNSQIGSASVRSGSGGSAIVGGGERSNAPPVPGTRPMSTVQNPNRPPVPGSYPQTPNLNPHPGQQAWKPQTMVRLGMKQEVVVSFEGTSQYASGGPSTCGLASMNAVRVVMGYAAQSGAMDAGALIERIATSFCLEEIMAICALWPDPAHLEVENIRTLPLFRTNLEHVDSANETLTTDGFRSLLFRLQSFSTNHPNPRRFSAVVITRPPEIVALIHIPISDNHMLTSCFALFDSHPRPNKGTKGASWVLFGSLEKCVDYLAKELFFFDAGLLEGVNEWQAAMFSQFAGEFFIAPPMPTTGVPTEVQATYEANLELFKSLNDNAELQASVKELTRKLEEEKGRAKTAIELAQHEKSVVERKLRVVEREKLGLVANLRTKEDEVRMLGVKNESLVGEFGREKEEMQGIIGQLTEGAKARDMANIQAGRALSPRPLPLSPAPTIPLPVPTVDEEELREAQDMLRRLVDEKRILESRLASHNPDHITFTRHQELLAHQKEIHDLQLRLRDCEGALVHMTEMRDVAVQERERVRGDARSAMGASETLIEKLTAQCDRQLSIIEAHGHAHTSHPPPPPAGYPLTPRYSTDHLGSHILPSHSTSPSEDTMVLINSHTSARREAEDKLGEVEDSLRSIRADNESALDKLCESEKVVQELTEERDKLLGEIEELKNSLEKKAGMKEELSRAIGEGAKAESEVKQLRWEMQLLATRLEKVGREKGEAGEQVRALEERVRELMMERESRSSVGFGTSPSVTSVATVEYRDKGKGPSEPAPLRSPPLPSIRDVDTNSSYPSPSPTATAPTSSVRRTPTPHDNEDLSTTEGVQYLQHIHNQGSFDRHSSAMSMSNPSTTHSYSTMQQSQDLNEDRQYHHNSATAWQDPSPPPSAFDTRTSMHAPYNTGVGGMGTESSASSTDLRNGGNALAYGQTTFVDNGMRKKTSLTSRLGFGKKNHTPNAEIQNSNALRTTSSHSTKIGHK